MILEQNDVSMSCSRCQSSNYCKDGIVKGRQPYLCKTCGFRYTVEKKAAVKSRKIKHLALQMYLDSLGFRLIGRVLKISYQTVYQWVKKWGSKVSIPQSTEPIAVVELDEMRSYVGSKKLLLDMDCY